MENTRDQSKHAPHKARTDKNAHWSSGISGIGASSLTQSDIIATLHQYIWEIFCTSVAKISATGHIKILQLT